MAKSKKEYFANNWQQYKDSPDEDFIPHTFEEVMSWKVAGWELPSSVYCVIRVMDKETRAIKEHVYSRPGAAQNKVQQLLNTAGIEFTVCDHNSIHHLTEKPIDD